MEFDDLANLIKNRRSIRSWQDKAVSEELLIQAVELATWVLAQENVGQEARAQAEVICNALKPRVSAAALKRCERQVLKQDMDTIVTTLLKMDMSETW